MKSNIPPEALLLQWGKFKLLLSGRAVYLALVLAALVAVLHLWVH